MRPEASEHLQARACGRELRQNPSLSPTQQHHSHTFWCCSTHVFSWSQSVTSFVHACHNTTSVFFVVGCVWGGAWSLADTGLAVASLLSAIDKPILHLSVNPCRCVCCTLRPWRTQQSRPTASRLTTTSRGVLTPRRQGQRQQRQTCQMVVAAAAKHRSSMSSSSCLLTAWRA